MKELQEDNLHTCHELCSCQYSKPLSIVNNSELQEVKVMTAGQIYANLKRESQGYNLKSFDERLSEKFIPLSSLASIRERIEKDKFDHLMNDVSIRRGNPHYNENCYICRAIKSQENLLDEIEGKRE